jgi:hypothetical protein
MLQQTLKTQAVQQRLNQIGEKMNLELTYRPSDEPEVEDDDIMVKRFGDEVGSVQITLSGEYVASKRIGERFFFAEPTKKLESAIIDLFVLGTKQNG